MAINQQITSAPPAPQRSDPNTFADRADAFVAWLENLDDELNQWASECNSTEENINTLHDETQTYKNQAQQAASDAEIYKNEAQQSASDAETYKNQAQQAATESDNNLREFKGRYYGAYNSAPTTDPYGDPIDEGDMYWDTTEKKLYVWDGSQWKVGSIYDLYNADQLDGEEGSYYTNASNLNAGTIPVERLSGTYNIDISGNAATASNAGKLEGHDASYFATSSHNHDSRYVLKTGDTINGNLSVNGVINVGRQDNANEGGEIHLAQSVNGDLTQVITIDNYVNDFRIFTHKSNGHVSGIQIDLENTPDGVHTIWHSGNDGSGSGLDADKWDGGHKHISTASPSGGSDGDVWFKY